MSVTYEINLDLELANDFNSYYRDIARLLGNVDVHENPARALKQELISKLMDAREKLLSRKKPWPVCIQCGKSTHVSNNCRNMPCSKLSEGKVVRAWIYSRFFNKPRIAALIHEQAFSLTRRVKSSRIKSSLTKLPVKKPHLRSLPVDKAPVTKTQVTESKLASQPSKFEPSKFEPYDSVSIEDNIFKDFANYHKRVSNKLERYKSVRYSTPRLQTLERQLVYYLDDFSRRPNVWMEQRTDNSCLWCAAEGHSIKDCKSGLVSQDRLEDAMICEWITDTFCHQSRYTLLCKQTFHFERCLKKTAVTGTTRKNGVKMHSRSSTTRSNNVSRDVKSLHGPANTLQAVKNCNSNKNVIESVEIGRIISNSETTCKNNIQQSGCADSRGLSLTSERSWADISDEMSD